MTTKEIVLKFGHDPLLVLRELGGYYACPKNADGQRQGPLVGYAGRDNQGRQFVGDIYANWAAAEEYPIVLDHFAGSILGHSSRAKVFCGAPMGGIALAQALARRQGNTRFVFPEKKVIEVASATSREVSKLQFLRHQIHPGETVVVVEDVLNNFSTTDMLLDLIDAQGGVVVALMALLNRSSKYQADYRGIPIGALVYNPFPQYQQDDPAVAADVAAGNVVWKPKDEWPRLMAAMTDSETK
jgi:adenine/guanine phosphoribosyltransferase-like PRPP-binding protein